MRISQKLKCVIMQNLRYIFFKGRRRSWDFKICISAPLVKSFRMYWKMLISYHSINEIWNNKQIIKQHSLFYQIYPTLRMNYLLSNISVFRKQPFSSSVVVLGRNTVLSNDYQLRKIKKIKICLTHKVRSSRSQLPAGPSYLFSNWSSDG